jgi:hypothetical protein
MEIDALRTFTPRDGRDGNPLSVSIDGAQPGSTARIVAEGVS